MVRAGPKQAAPAARRLARIAAGALATALATTPVASAAAPPRPNIVLFVADDLGARDLGFANQGTFHESPHLDRLAREGVRFTAGYAANPVCSPTRYSILTGRYPTRAGLTNWLSGLRNERFAGAPLATAIPHHEKTLSRSLRDAGYRTAFVGKWHLGDTPENWPEHHGFEFNVAGHGRGAPSSFFSPYANPRLADGPPGEHLTARLAEESVRLIEEFARGGAPFLLVHSFYAVHNPLQAPDALVGKYRDKAERLGLADAFGEERQFHVRATSARRVRATQRNAAYAALIEMMDTAAGRILARLGELGLAEHTVVVFLSDNGGLSTAEGLPTSNAPLRAGKGWIYEGGIRVPFVIRWPGTTRPGAVIDTPVMSIDLMPTLLAAAGVAPQPGVDGRDLAPLLRGHEAPQRDLFWHYPHYSNQGGFPGGAIRSGDWKLVENYEDGVVELYHLAEDEAERRDLAGSPGHAELVRDLRSRLHSWYRHTGARFLGPLPDGPQPWTP